MIALQSAPALGPPIVLWVACCLVGIGLGATGSALVRRLSNPVLKYRWLYLGVLGPYGVVAYWLLAALDLGAAVRGAVMPGVGGIVGEFVMAFVTLLGAGGAVLAAYVPTIRGVRAVREVEVATMTALARMARYVVGLCALLAGFVVAVGRVVGGTIGGVEVIALFAAFALVLVVGSPWLVGLLNATRRPTGTEIDRLTALRERAGLTVRDARVLETGGADTATAYVRGPPGVRRLFVSDTFLDAFEDRTATALLAVKAQRVKAHVLARRFVAVIVAGALVVAAFGGEGLSTPLLVAAALALLGGLWFARRGVRVADDRAAQQVGSDALADALGEYAAFHGMEPSRRRVPNPLSANVALGDRIDRLRASGSAPTD